MSQLPEKKTIGREKPRRTTVKKEDRDLLRVSDPHSP